jgi:hypothetical protein
VKRSQTQCLSPKGEFWVCSETNFRMVKNSFQRAKWVLGNSPLNIKYKHGAFGADLAIQAATFLTAWAA